MINFERIDKNRKSILIGIIASIVLFLLLLASMITIGFKVNDDNALILRIISIILMVLLGSGIIAILTELIYIKSVENKFLKALKQANEIEINGAVTLIGDETTTSKYRKSKIIEVNNDENKSILYFDMSEMACTLEIGKSYIFKTRNNFIVSFEEVKQ